ncbi:hypothetical protein ACFX15_028630 [Malus domestica]
MPLPSSLSSSPTITNRPSLLAADNRPTLEVVFDPLEEVKKELLLVPTIPHASLARQKYSDKSEAAINEQIKDNVALKGLAKFFKESSEVERQHAEKLMEYQNKRGGKVKLQSMRMPVSEFGHVKKGDALCAIELALGLEKLNNEKLLNLHTNENNDVQLVDFVESNYLTEQVEAIYKMSKYVAQLRRIVTGHGVRHFDQMLLNGNAA